MNTQGIRIPPVRIAPLLISPTQLDRTLQRVVMSDNFTRADGAIGTTETGQAYTTGGGTWVVTSNTAGLSAFVSNAVAFADCGYKDATISVINTTFNLSGGLVARATDATHFIRLLSLTDTLFLQAIGGGTLSTSVAYTGQNNDTLTLWCTGNSIFAYVNGVLKLSGTESFNNTATAHGLALADTSSRLDNFRVTV